MPSPNACVSEKSIDVQVLYSDELFVTASPVAGPSGVGAFGPRISCYSEKLSSMWNCRKIYSKLRTHDQCNQFAERGRIPKQKMRSYHHLPMTFMKESGQLGKFRCHKSKCHKKLRKAPLLTLIIGERI